MIIVGIKTVNFLWKKFIWIEWTCDFAVWNTRWSLKLVCILAKRHWTALQWAVSVPMNRQRIARMSRMLFVYICGSHCKCAKHNWKQVADRDYPTEFHCQIQTREFISSTLWLQTVLEIFYIYFFSIFAKKHPPFLVFWLQNPFTFEDSLMFFVNRL